MSLDFNNFSDAAPQRGEKTTSRPDYGRDEVEAGLLSRAEQFILYLYPDAILEKRAAYIGNIHGAPGQSMKIDTNGPTRGRWHDFASGDTGGDMIGLYMAANNMHPKAGFRRALKECAAWLGIADSYPELQSHNKRKATASKRKRPDMGPAVATWVYHSPDGTPLAEIRRHEYTDHKGNVKKEFLPYTYTTNSYMMPSPRHLYNAHLFNSGKLIVFVEGEKCADAITATGVLIGTTVMGGAKATAQADFSGLFGRSVTLWRDNDEPGKQWEQDLLQRLPSEAVKIVDTVTIPADKPEKWDAADAGSYEILELIASTQSGLALYTVVVSAQDWVDILCNGADDE